MEDFENGDLSKWKQVPAGHWISSSEQPISGKRSLRQWSDSANAAVDKISRSLDGLSVALDTIIFRFRLKHGSNPSVSNRWAIYLGYDEDAEQMQPNAKGNGYALGVNMNSSDDIIRLFRINNGILHEILNTKFNWENSVGTIHGAGIEVERFPSGEWKISISKTGSFDSLVFYGSVINNENTEFLNFGIYYEYTITRNGMLWFDDLSISGKFIPDTIAPFVRSINALNDSSLAISFSKNMDFDTKNLKSKFLLKDEAAEPDSIILIRKDSIIICFGFAFKDQSWIQLILKDLKDLAGNMIKTDTLSCFFKIIKLNDIGVNEIMPDPSPAVHLPEYEYIELYNRTDNPVNLKNWTISCGNEQKLLPSFILDGKQYLILCQSSAVNLFKPYGNVLGIFSSGSFLSNNGACIQLKSSEGVIISMLCYSADWIVDPDKSKGGWSLEKIDPDIACSGKENWTTSKDKNGGTPGKQNSVLKFSGDHEPPKIISVFPDTDSSLVVSFDETIGLNYPAYPGAFRVDHDIGSPMKCVILPDYKKINLSFKNHFFRDISYSLFNDGSILDCAGNAAIIEANEFQLPAQPDSQDVVFNEIMYHPISGCSEFIELYNRSKHAFNLADFHIACRDLISGDLRLLSSNIEENKLFFPGEFIVLTSNSDQLISCYPQAIRKSIIQFTDMPALTDDGLKLQLILRDLSVIDEMVYKDAMQFALLSNSIGVSLERIDYNRSSTDPSNWHSASSSSGFCTPGAKNSQFIETENSNSVLNVDPEVFSPNNDGINDILNISYCFDTPGFVGNLIIYDSKGRQVKRIANNDLLACRGQYSWDGSNDSRIAVPPGIYIIWFEVFNLAGRSDVFKRICVVSKTR